jgi:hypothetical protein
MALFKFLLFVVVVFVVVVGRNTTLKLDVSDYTSKYLYFLIYTCKSVVNVDTGILYK